MLISISSKILKKEVTNNDYEVRQEQSASTPTHTCSWKDFWYC
ncbi:hypothetical protein WVIC16_130061 [Weissella viridescens]|nr:hypothetical protein WVIC16_130061 [Weissella viridescens]